LQISIPQRPFGDFATQSAPIYTTLIRRHPSEAEGTCRGRRHSAREKMPAVVALRGRVKLIHRRNVENAVLRRRVEPHVRRMIWLA
jgi:hypothetical protein